MPFRVDGTTKFLSRTSTTGLWDTTLAWSACGWCTLQVDRNDWSAIFAVENASGANIFQTDATGTNLIVATGAGTSSTIINPAVGTPFFWAMSNTGNADAGGLIGYAALDSDANLTSQSMTATDVTTGSTRTLRWGKDASDEFTNADHSALKIWNGVVLTAADFALERWSIIPRRTLDLWGWWPSINNGATELGIDYSGNGRALTVNGAPASAAFPPVPWGGVLEAVVENPVAAAGAPQAGTLWGKTFHSLTLRHLVG